jgi:hypothetical protein
MYFYINFDFILVFEFNHFETSLPAEDIFEASMMYSESVNKSHASVRYDTDQEALHFKNMLDFQFYKSTVSLYDHIILLFFQLLGPLDLRTIS